jgi:16S rRNA (guanine966-N2)-methyltransferase
MTRDRKTHSRPRGVPPAAGARETHPRSATHSGHHRVRIIGGRWRSLRIDFPDHAELRPSPDRVRETLFNWLQHSIMDARCLDLFAGSGVLGAEALSRGAAEVVFVERDARTALGIEATLQRLGAVGATVVQADALKYLDSPPPQPFDIVFLDPPYAAGLLPEVCGKLARHRWLAPQAQIYMESSADQPLPAFPAAWTLHRSRQAGQVGYHLLRV